MSEFEVTIAITITITVAIAVTTTLTITDKISGINTTCIDVYVAVARIVCAATLIYLAVAKYN